MTEPPEITRLRACLSACEDETPGAAEAVGLLMTPELRPSGYDATPQGALTFAWTGGDGIHFSLLDAAPHGPVAMTVPMQFDRPNVVVGENLREFVGLGLARGFFVLEGLAYDLPGAAAELDTAANMGTLDPLAARTLRSLAAAFGAVPWREHAARLDALAARFGHLLPAAVD